MYQHTEPSNAAGPRPAPTLALLLGILVLAAGLFAAQKLVVPSPASPATVSQEQFSAERAWPILERLYADGLPHPLDTEAGDAMRQRVVAEFEALGYEVQLQTAWGCRVQYTTCGLANNVLVRLPGQLAGPALMVTAHYDSVGAGPGVADDMAGVAAIIEVARMLRSSPPLLNTVLFVITDGEESGLLGAEAFMNHPWVNEVGLIANYEARGTGGQSLLFQTSPGNAWLIDQYVSAAPRPATSSLLYEIYRMLPNDTDLSVYLDAGIPGINFAFVEHVQRYHTVLDNLEYLDRDTFQHQGENVLAAVRAFGNANLSSMPAGNAIYQDVLPGLVVRAPEGWGVFMAGGALVLWLLIVLALLGAGALTGGGLAVALVSTLVALAAAAGAAMGVAELIKMLTGAGEPWYAHALPTRIAVWAAAAFGYLLVTSLAARRAGFWGMAAAVWLWWTALSIAAAVLLPGTAVMPLLPTLIATTLFALLALFGVGLPARRSATVGWLPVVLVLVSVFATGYLVLQLAYMFELALGFGLAVALGLLVALALSSTAPLLATPRGTGMVRGGLMLLALLVAAGGAVWATRVPAYSAERPQRLNLGYAQVSTAAAESSSHWYVSGVNSDDLPAALAQVGGFGATRTALPGGLGSPLTVPAPAMDYLLPTLEVLSDTTVGSERLIAVRLGSPRGASQMTLRIPRMAGLTAIDVPSAQRTITYPRRTGDEYDAFQCVGRSCSGLEITLHVGVDRTFDIVIVDQSAGLPPAGQALLAARPATASPTHGGDTTAVFSSMRFEPAN